MKYQNPVVADRTKMGNHGDLNESLKVQEYGRNMTQFSGEQSRAKKLHIQVKKLAFNTARNSKYS